jgi:hypothetical protein
MKSEKPLTVNEGSFGGLCVAVEERLPEGLPIVNNLCVTPAVGQINPHCGAQGGQSQDGCAASAARRPGADPPFLVNKSNNCNEGKRDFYNFRLSSVEQKTVLVLKENVGKMVELCGLEKVGFLTLTTPDNCSYWSKEGWQEAQKRYHSFMSRAYPEIFGKTSRRVVVLEPQRRGAVHWHMVIECPGDIRTGVNFDEFKEKDYSSAGKILRGLWKELRASCGLYDLGRHELLPVRTSKEAISNYVGGYIAKSILREVSEGDWEKVKRPFHSRRVRYSQGAWRSANTNFAWVAAGHKWRAAVCLTAAELGITSIEQFSRRFGSRWAYTLGPMIIDNYERKQRG